jgi:hypothetical protein
MFREKLSLIKSLISNSSKIVLSQIALHPTVTFVANTLLSLNVHFSISSFFIKTYSSLYVVKILLPSFLNLSIVNLLTVYKPSAIQLPNLMLASLTLCQ